MAERSMNETGVAKLSIRKERGSGAFDVMVIGGFAEGELEELKMLPHMTAKDRLLEMLDARNGGIATCWHNGPGVYGLWFDNEYAYLNIGRSSD